MRACCTATKHHANRVTLEVKQTDGCSSPGGDGRKCYLFEVQEALTSATGTPSGGRQCNTIMPFRGTSVPWGSCSKFFLRSKRENKQPALKKNYSSMKEQEYAICFMCDLLHHTHTHTNMKKNDAFYKIMAPGLKNNLFPGTIRSVWYQNDLQAIRTVALRLLEVPRWLQATHRHQ